MNRRQHDPGLKAKARTIYQTHGAKRAAELVGLPVRTVRHWARTEGWRQPATATGNPRHLHVAPVPDTPQRPIKATVAGYQRMALLQQLGAEALACLAMIEQEREAGRSGAARNWAWCVGILLQRAEELAKAAGAVGGPEQDPQQAVAALERVLDAIEGRVAGA